MALLQLKLLKQDGIKNKSRHRGIKEVGMEEQLYICDQIHICPNEICEARKPRDKDRMAYSSLWDRNWICSYSKKISKAIPYKEEKMEEKYRPKTSNISMMTMGQKINCSGFRGFCKDILDKGYGITQDIPFDILILYAKEHNGIQCLIDKGFLEKVEPEVFYKIGDEFEYDNVIYKLVLISSFEALLINYESANRAFNPAIKINGKISAKAFHEWAGTKFKKIS